MGRVSNIAIIVVRTAILEPSEDNLLSKNIFLMLIPSDITLFPLLNFQASLPPSEGSKLLIISEISLFMSPFALYLERVNEIKDLVEQVISMQYATAEPV